MSDKLLRESIIDVLNYFAIFSFPLTKEEVHRYVSASCSIEEIEIELNSLLKKGTISILENFYMLVSNETNAERKRSGAIFATKKLKEAKGIAKLIHLFPFVRMVGVSGSLSKGYFEKGDDIDFFIVTSKNRLWIARTLLHIMKKSSYLIGKQHSLCMNYFVDETALKLEDENYFIALELATVIPLYGKNHHDALIKTNHWIYDFVPNITINKRYLDTISEVKGIKKCGEFLWNSDRLNVFLMNLTDRKWRKKWSKRGFDMSKYDRAFKTTLHVSKNHPNDYQEKIRQDLLKQNNTIIGSKP